MSCFSRSGCLLILLASGKWPVASGNDEQLKKYLVTINDTVKL